MSKLPSFKLLEKVEAGPREYPQRRVFSEPSGKSAVLSHPEEFHMGAWAWRLRIESDARNITPRELGSSDRATYNCPFHYQPWNYNGQKLFLTTWDKLHPIFDFASKSLKSVDLDALPVSVLGSRRFPRFLTVTTKSIQLLSDEGKAIRHFELRKPMHGFPYVGWLDAASQFFALEPSARGKARFRFFSEEDAEDLGALEFNPVDFFPYDEAPYSALSRDSFGLWISASRQAVVSLLDEWSEFSFDQHSCKFEASIFRPVSPTLEKDGRPVVKVKELRVKIQFEF